MEADYKENGNVLNKVPFTQFLWYLRLKKKRQRTEKLTIRNIINN